MRRALFVLALATLGCQGPKSPAGTTTLFLNRAGVSLHAGSDDASRNQSSLVRGDVTLPAATLDEAAWAGVVDCVRAQFAAFDVRIVEERPRQAGYLMAVFGGTGDELGAAADVMGRAPMDTDECSTIDSAVVMVFTAKIGPNVRQICEIAAHEIAHTFSVDHQLLASEPTSYLSYDGEKTFQDLDAPCGESAERACVCGRPSQNSFRLLTERLGPSPLAAADVTAPSVDLDWTPSKSGLAVRVRASDDFGVARVALSFHDGTGHGTAVCGDGTIPCAALGGEFRFSLPARSGEVRFHATVTDRAGNRAVTSEQAVIFEN